MRYTFEIQARPVGNLGITFHDVVAVEAPNYDKAVLALYDTHEHIRILGWSVTSGNRLVECSEVVRPMAEGW
jgi:hypothetical protein